MENCEQSLKNMKLDYIDLYYCHRYDENTDLEETLRAMSDLVAQGKFSITVSVKNGEVQELRKPKE